MNSLLTNAKKLLKEEIKGKSNYSTFMDRIKPIDKYLDQHFGRIADKTRLDVSLTDLYLLSIKRRLNDIKFDLRSLKREVSYNGGIIDFSNIDTYDDYAIEDIFKNTHVIVETLKTLNQ